AETGADQGRGLARAEPPAHPLPREITRDDRDGKEDPDGGSLGREGMSTWRPFAFCHSFPSACHPEERSDEGSLEGETRRKAGVCRDGRVAPSGSFAPLRMTLKVEGPEDERRGG